MRPYQESHDFIINKQRALCIVCVLDTKIYVLTRFSCCCLFYEIPTLIIRQQQSTELS